MIALDYLVNALWQEIDTSGITDALVERTQQLPAEISAALSDTAEEDTGKEKPFPLFKRPKRGESRFKSGKLSLLRLIRALSLITKINGIWGSTLQLRKPRLGSGLPKKTKLKAVWNFARTTNNYEEAHNIVKSYMIIKRAIIHKSTCLQLRAFKDMAESRTRSPRTGSNGSTH
jgi:hypothetical protein